MILKGFLNMLYLIALKQTGGDKERAMILAYLKGQVNGRVRDSKVEGEPMIAKTVRVIRELFLPDTDLRKALGLAPQVVIIEVVRKTGVYRKGGDIDLQGSLVTVYDPKDT